VPFSFLFRRWLAGAGLAPWHPRARRFCGPGAEQLRHCSDSVLGLPAEAMVAAAAALAPVGPDVIDLTLGAPSPDLSRLPAARPGAERFGWPSLRGLQELRQAIALHLQSNLGLTRDPEDEILVTLGATGALQAALAAFVNPGDRVVLFEPASPLFYLLASARGAQIRWVPTFLENGKLHFRAHLLAQALRGARMLLFSNPANPQGGIFSAEDLEQIAWWADRRDVLLFSDDSFAAFAYDHPLSAIASLPKAFRRALHAGGVSKTQGHPGLRVGWLSAERSLLRPCLALQAVQVPFVPALCQQAAVSLLHQNSEGLDKLRLQLASRRQYAFERLQSIGLAPDWPAGGFFLWTALGLPGWSGQVFADRLLEEKRVRVSPGSLFGPGGVGHIRLSFAVEDGRLREGLARFAEFHGALAPKAQVTRAA
jgi:aspartate/methionine/tyrosine aminotransferase